MFHQSFKICGVTIRAGLWRYIWDIECTFELTFRVMCFRHSAAIYMIIAVCRLITIDRDRNEDLSTLASVKTINCSRSSRNVLRSISLLLCPQTLIFFTYIFLLPSKSLTHPQHMVGSNKWLDLNARLLIFQHRDAANNKAQEWLPPRLHSQKLGTSLPIARRHCCRIPTFYDSTCLRGSVCEPRLHTSHSPLLLSLDNGIRTRQRNHIFFLFILISLIWWIWQL